LFSLLESILVNKSEASRASLSGNCCKQQSRYALTSRAIQREHSIDGFRASDTCEGSTRSRQNSVPVADPGGRVRRDEGQHGGDEDPGQLPRVSRAQTAEGVHATPPSFAVRATATTAATAATEPAGPATGPGKEAKAEGISPEEAEHSGGARGEIGDEDPGGHSRLLGAEETAGRAGRGDEDPGWFPWLQDAKIAKAKRPVGYARLRFLSRCRDGGDAGCQSAQEVLTALCLVISC